MTVLSSLLRTRSDEDEEALAVVGAFADVYHIGREGRTWVAACRHGIPVLLTARKPSRLRTLIADDWRRRSPR